MRGHRGFGGPGRGPRGGRRPGGFGGPHMPPPPPPPPRRGRFFGRFHYGRPRGGCLGCFTIAAIPILVLAAVIALVILL